MPHGEVVRDPETGQFRSAEGFDMDIEYVTFNVDFSVPAADLAGATDQFYGNSGRWQGVQLYDLDDILDRDDVAAIVHAQHLLSAQPTGTQTADSAAVVSCEISASPSRAILEDTTPGELTDIADSGGVTAEATEPRSDDTVDLLGRPLQVMSQGPFTDGTNGLGGGGGGDTVDALKFNPVGFDIDRRDEMFVNGRWEAQNISDGPLTWSVVGQHILQVLDQ